MKKPLCLIKHCKVIIIIVLSLPLFNLYSAVSDKNKKTLQKETNTFGRTAIISSYDKNKRSKHYTYFALIDEEIMKDVENGSPSSLRKAALSLKKPELDYKENEKVLLNVQADIMKIVWPTERINWDVPEILINTPYTGAIKSVLNGIYDTSTGNVDFLTLILPSLVIAVVDDVKDFFELSFKALNEGLLLRENSVLVNYLLGLLYKKNKMYQEAVPYLFKAVSNAPECFQAALAYAECLNFTGKMNEVDNVLLNLNEKYPMNPEVLKLSAKLYFQLNNYIKAEEYISRVLQQNPNDLDSILFRAKVLMKKKDFIRAAALLDIYSRQDNSSKEYLLLRAEIQYGWSKNISAAVASIETALNNYPNDIDVLLFAAKIASSSFLEINGNQAEDFASKVLQQEPENKEALEYSIISFMQKNDWKKAYEISSSLLAKGIEHQDIIFRHVKICLAFGKKDEAWNLIYPVYNAQNQDEEVIQIYITVMSETGRQSQARTLINKMLADVSSSKMKSFLYYRRSFLQNSKENILSDLRSSLIANPRNTDALYKLYKIYYAEADFRKAQYYLKQVAALNSNDSGMKRLLDELSALVK